MALRGWLAVALLLGITRAAGAQPTALTPLSVFVLGGTGTTAPGNTPAGWSALLAQARTAGPTSVLVVVGDILPAKGLPAEEESGRREAEQVLRPLLAALQEFPGRVVVIPGEAEWQSGGARGWQRVRNLESFLKAQMPEAILAPVGGCPGPVELPLDATHTLVVLDTQWWLHAWEKPAPESAPASGCDAQDPAAVVAQLEDILGRNQGKHVLVAGHHPLFSSGYGVALATLPNPRVRLLRRSLIAVLDRYPNLTYVGGHEHSLQYLEPAKHSHYVVSGAGATAGGRQPRKNAAFSRRATGFARLDYGLTDSVVLTLRSAEGSAMFRKAWVEPTTVGQPLPNALVRIRPDSVVAVRAGLQYQAGTLRSWLLGRNYRAEWAQSVSVPVLDLGTMHGGLTPVKRGGGLQTQSLRLRGGDGQEYVLRSVSKEVSRAVPAYLRYTLAADVVQDQISASHPYAALAVPLLAEAAGVPHTRPQLVLVPDDPRLGPYRQGFGRTLGLLEARDPSPSSAQKGVLLPKSYSTQDVLDQLQADSRDRVDQRQVLRARLLDMVLADWDRHDDQWRWLAYARPGGGRLYRAAPRDRDQVFFVNQGFVPRQASVDWVLPKFQGFDFRFRNVNTFNFQARYFDRSFLTALGEDDWRSIADSLRNSLTDAVLVRALHQLPDSMYRLSGPVLLAKLQAQRDQLPQWASQYYRFLAREVDVVGSDQRESFEVERLPGGHLTVAVVALSAQGQRGEVLYRRDFSSDHTREVRLYGLGGNDAFTISGQAAYGPLVRIIGGAGADTVVDASQVRHGPRKTRVYDERLGMQLAAGPETLDLRSAAPDVNSYERTAFQYDYTGPLYPLAYNVDDGFFLGYGVLWRRPGFRNPPWANTQRVLGNVALATGGFSFAYAGQFNHLLGPYDARISATVQAPNYVRNFFGLGNEVDYDDDRSIRYYRVRFNNLVLGAELQRRLGDYWQVQSGPVYQRVKVEDSPGRYIAENRDERLNRPSLFTSKQYAGATVGFAYDHRAEPLLLPQGAVWRTELSALAGLGAARPLTTLTTELALYRSLHFPLRLTLATRFGGAVVLSRGYEFFQAATLDGLTNLRGFRRTRFAGRQSAYNNTEVRVQVGHFRTYLFPATYGLIGFHDVGRVWVAGEQSSTWHRGYGGGVWVAPFQQVVLSAMYALSREESLPLVRLGFFF